MSGDLQREPGSGVESGENRKPRAIRGFGSSYRRGRTWWIRYHHRGQGFRESSRSERVLDAERLLKDRWKQIGRGKFIGPREDKVLVNDLLHGLVRDYEQNGRRSVDTLKGRPVPVRAAFGFRSILDITGAMVERYKGDRLAARTRRTSPVAVATLNRELAALKRAFRLGLEQERIAHVPIIKLLAEHNVREGFVEPALSLSWSDVDLDARRLRLRRENSKNEQPRVIVLTGDLLRLVQRCWAARQYQTRGGGVGLSPWVFHRDGRRIVDFRDAWAKACIAAKFPGLLFHDLRRSAVRNMEKSEVTPAVAMKITGHKTDSVYRRYRIVDESDIERALAKTQESIRHAPADNVAEIRKVGRTRRRT